MHPAGGPCIRTTLKSASRVLACNGRRIFPRPPPAHHAAGPSLGNETVTVATDGADASGPSVRKYPNIGKKLAARRPGVSDVRVASIHEGR